MSAESYCDVFVPVSIRISYRFCHSGSVLVFGRSPANCAGVVSVDPSLITGSPSATKPFKLAGHAAGAGLNTVSRLTGSPVHNAGFCPFAGR